MKNHTILIVDDQLVNRMILRKLLQEDYQLLEAENGALALDILREKAGEISAVLLDIVMPVLDGYEVLRIMQNDSVLSKIPVIVSSQKDGDEAEERALKLGAQDFIAKPYKANIIRHRLNNTIRFRETAALMNRVERDELTGLLSKQFFLEKVTDWLRKNPDEPCDLIAFGVERFKLVNDTFGVSTGDQLLRHIAAVLTKMPQVLLSTRFTADHFYMLVPQQAENDTAFLNLCRQKICTFPINMKLNVNCGVYHIENTPAGVIGMCDRALLAADAHKGRFDVPCCYYDESMRQRLLGEQFIVSNMREALEQHQFQVYYQPKYDLNNEMIAGAEALVRWIHPTRGFLSPGEFIPLFEHNGFITQLDAYVWETACRDIRGWIDKGYAPIAVSVNVSRADVYNPALTKILLGLIERYRIPIRCLHLEITESAYTSNQQQIIAVVENLRKLGFLIEMDDFGSGYSSLNMLAEMPVDVLKLDMGFVQHETSHPSGRGILSFAISLAKWLDLAVVAEGVETAEQIATLRSMDCNYVQGFYYAKPMKLEDFDKLLQTSQITEMICNSRTAAAYASPEQMIQIENAGNVMLIVDDIELNRALLAGSFEGQFTIVEKEDGKQAWDYLQDNYDRVSIVLLDLLMPVMDGFQLLDKIRRDSRMTELPVIITSQGDANSEQRALAMQADDFISKPYNPEIIRHRVRSAIELRYLHRLQHRVVGTAQSDEGPLTENQKTLLFADSLKPYFDIVRLVNPEQTLVCEQPDGECGMDACFSVWGKATRCQNCTSLRALCEKNRQCKLEYANQSAYFVISQYMPFEPSGAVLELVIKLEPGCIEEATDLH